MTTPPTACIDPKDFEGFGVVTNAGAEGDRRVAIASGLGNCMSPKSIAKQIGASKSARALFAGATGTLDDEFTKQRT